MASRWGDSWGLAWGNSWDIVATPEPEPTPEPEEEGGESAGGGGYARPRPRKAPDEPAVRRSVEILPFPLSSRFRMPEPTVSGGATAAAPTLRHRLGGFLEPTVTGGAAIAPDPLLFSERSLLKMVIAAERRRARILAADVALGIEVES